MQEPPYYLGCPIWASNTWLGHFFREKTPRKNWLPEYSRVHNTVEGNTVFYGLPTESTARRWVEDVAPGFRFALKFPRVISHELQLQHCESELSAFLAILYTLQEGNCLGSSFLQLPPTFSSRELPRLDTFLRTLPPELPWAVEVRHIDFFENEAESDRLNELLRELNVDRVLLDSRPIFARPLVVADEDEKEARTKKPRLPAPVHVTGEHPMLRIISSNDPVINQKYNDEWAPVVAGWIREGLQPYVFLHAAGYKLAPDFCRAFHQTLQKELPELPDRPLWPIEQAEPGSQQLELF